jgi:hypothetical protein
VPEAGFLSLLAPWVGGAGGLLLMSEPPPPVLPVRMQQRHDVLERMLRRLPPSLWDIDATSATVQRDLYRAFAAQLGLWLEQRDIARTMTLLLEAQGVDLDTLLQDYGLRRYLQRPDPYARQVGMHILWMPKGTLYSVARLADLLFDLPHVTLRTGRSQQHVFVAATHPVTTPYSYWGLVSAEGLWYAVTVHGEVPTISQAPPPGLDLSPGPHTLTWFTVQDELGAPWYVSIHGDTLQIEPTRPAGYGTTEPFVTLDGAGHRWFLAADSASAALVSLRENGVVVFGTWQVRSHEDTVYHLWIDAQVPTIAPTAPGGTVDQTPGGTPLDWFTVADEMGTPWYVTIEHDTLMLQESVPGGMGTATLAALFDTHGQRWVLTVAASTEALVTTEVNLISPTNPDLVVLAPTAPFQAFQLVDSASVPWWICIDAGTLFLTSSLPIGAADVTPPAGPYQWWRVYDLAGTLWYASPSTLGVMVLDLVSPGGKGTAQPQVLGDTAGVLWHVGVDPAGNLGLSDTPPVDTAGRATAVCLKDATGVRWFWRVHGQVLEWSPVLWPDTLDQSPWGDLGWLYLLGTDGVARYVFPTPLGDAMAALGPPVPSPWGWSPPIQFLDHAGTPWRLTVLPDDRVGVLPDLPDDLPLPTTALPLSEALEAFVHVQAAGSSLTLLVT